MQMIVKHGDGDHQQNQAESERAVCGESAWYSLKYGTKFCCSHNVFGFGAGIYCDFNEILYICGKYYIELMKTG